MASAFAASQLRRDKRGEGLAAATGQKENATTEYVMAPLMDGKTMRRNASRVGVGKRHPGDSIVSLNCLDVRVLGASTSLSQLALRVSADVGKTLARRPKREAHSESTTTLGVGLAPEVYLPRWHGLPARGPWAKCPCQFLRSSVGIMRTKRAAQPLWLNRPHSQSIAIPLDSGTGAVTVLCILAGARMVRAVRRVVELDKTEQFAHVDLPVLR